jgi:hypothetical protein
MEKLNLKPTHKPVQNYYEALRQFKRIGVSHEESGRLNLCGSAAAQCGKPMAFRPDTILFRGGYASRMPEAQPQDN